MSGWRALLERHGHRGLKEIDIAQARNREAPGLLLQQILQARQIDPALRSQAIHARGAAARRAAFATLSRYAEDRESWWTYRRLRKAMDLLGQLGGLRETHKFCLVYALDQLRAQVLRRAEDLHARGRLDDIDQVWSLTLPDLDAAERDDEIDLRVRAAERRAPIDRLARVRDLPRIIDSRGRILRAPPPPARDGELVGQPISAGVVQGVVKVLHAPDEKPLAAGEILVARATDPGWTPLFVPAAAIVLEVGGILQHGALVAREYGKPCVAGIARVTEELRDGMLVEVDGAAGVVRLVG